MEPARHSSPPRAPLPRRLFVGALSGALGALAMATTSYLLRRAMPPRARGKPPFEAVTSALERRAGLKGHVGPVAHGLATHVGHLGYGAVVGALYASAPRLTRAPAALEGATFGLLVWAVSYGGWLPALRLLPPPRATSTMWSAMNAASHAVWGAVVGAMVERRIPSGSLLATTPSTTLPSSTTMGTSIQQHKDPSFSQ